MGATSSVWWYADMQDVLQMPRLRQETAAVKEVIMARVQDGRSTRDHAHARSLALARL
jgi:hypothetical protein